MDKTARQISDQEWIASVLTRLEQPLVRYTHRLTRDVDRAREVVQEAFLKLCRADRPSVEGHVTEWLYTVCRNGALDQLRKARPLVTLNDCEQGLSPVRLLTGTLETPSKVVERHLQTGRILALLEELSEDQQEVIRLKFQDDLSYAEISKITGHSISNVGFLIHAGMKKTRERLRQQREGSYGGQ